MTNKYLEKVAFTNIIGGYQGAKKGGETPKEEHKKEASIVGAIAGYRNSKKGDKLGGALSGAAAGAGASKVVTHATAPMLLDGTKAIISRSKHGLPVTGKHIGATAAAVGGAMVAETVAAYGSGKMGAKLYSKAKEKVNKK